MTSVLHRTAPAVAKHISDPSLPGSPDYQPAPETDLPYGVEHRRLDPEAHARAVSELQDTAAEHDEDDPALTRKSYKHNRRSMRAAGVSAAKRRKGISRQQVDVAPHALAARPELADALRLQRDALVLQGAAKRAAEQGEVWVPPAVEGARRAARAKGKAQKAARRKGRR